MAGPKAVPKPFGFWKAQAYGDALPKTLKGFWKHNPKGFLVDKKANLDPSQRLSKRQIWKDQI